MPELAALIPIAAPKPGLMLPPRVARAGGQTASSEQRAASLSLIHISEPTRPY